MNFFTKIRKSFGFMLRLEKTVNEVVTMNRFKTFFETSDSSGVTDESIADREVIVSLTSYGTRLDNCYLAVESLLHQTLKPNRIVLWLDEKIYSDPERIPFTLRKQTERGLEIRLCEDIRSYKKLIPALESSRESVIITVDDDLMYPVFFVEKMVDAYRRDNSKIYFFLGHRMMFGRNGLPLPYRRFMKIDATGSSLVNMPIGVGGVLYPPGCFDERVVDRKLFMELCPTADDVWFKAMSLLKGTECEKIEVPNVRMQFVDVPNVETDKLEYINVTKGRNDVQLRNVFERFDLKNRVKSDLTH